MSYSDQKFYTRVMIPAVAAVSFGTATASGAAGHTLSDVCAGLPVFIRRCKINGWKLRCTVIPNAASTAVLAHLMNGTTTVGTAVLTTAAADGWVTGAVTDANSTFAAAGEAKINMTGTSTASGAACGSWDVFLEVQELYA